MILIFFGVTPALSAMATEIITAINAIPNMAALARNKGFNMVPR